MCTPRAYTKHTNYSKSIVQQRGPNRKTKGAGSGEKEERVVDSEEGRKRQKRGDIICYWHAICTAEL